jgi:hypothetical protein
MVESPCYRWPFNAPFQRVVIALFRRRFINLRAQVRRLNKRDPNFLENEPPQG